MSVFVDTSFLVALLDEDDARSSTAARLWEQVSVAGRTVLTTNYVVLECMRGAADGAWASPRSAG